MMKILVILAWVAIFLACIFLVASAVLNIIVIVVLVYKGHAKISPRRYIVCCMSFGNMFLALFRLVFELVTTLRPSSVSDEAYLVAAASIELHHFMTAFSLVMLCVELFFREKIQSMCKHPLLVAAVLGGVPWIMGLVIILPLYLVPFSDYNVSHESRATLATFRAAVYVGTIAPVCIAFIASLVTKLSTFSSTFDFYSRHGAQLRNYAEIGMQPQPGTASNPRISQASDMRGYVNLGHDGNYPLGELSASCQTDMALNTQNPTAHGNFSQAPRNYQPQPTPDRQSQTSTTYDASGRVRAISTNSPTAPNSQPTMHQAPQHTEKDTESEKNVLLGLSCVLAVLMLPYAIYSVVIDFGYHNRPLSMGVAGTLLFLLSLQWGNVSSIVWLKVLLSRRP